MLSTIEGSNRHCRQGRMHGAFSGAHVVNGGLWVAAFRSHRMSSHRFGERGGSGSAGADAAEFASLQTRSALFKRKTWTVPATEGIGTRDGGPCGTRASAQILLVRSPSPQSRIRTSGDRPSASVAVCEGVALSDASSTALANGKPILAGSKVVGPNMPPIGCGHEIQSQFLKWF